MKMFRNACIATFGFATAQASFAAGIDPVAIGAEIEAAGDKGQEVGGYVILAVVALVVVGIILSVVKKV